MKHTSTILIKILAGFALILHSNAIADEIDQPFVVKLATESNLDPLYLLPIQQDISELSESYILQLEKILAFDLTHNGSTFVSKRSNDSNQFGLSNSSSPGSAAGWRDRNIFYVVKPQIQNKSIKAVVLNVQGQALKNIDSISLSGDLKEDRRQIHRLADIIHKAFFGVEDASTHLLYTIKIMNSADSSKWISEVWEIDYDGGNPRQLTQDKSIVLILFICRQNQEINLVDFYMFHTILASRRSISLHLKIAKNSA